MFAVLHDWLILPIAHCFQWVLETSYQRTHDFGLAILMLSLVFNLVLLPAYHFAETVQGRERAARAAMQAKLEEFKRCFTGQERHMMIAALYRLHHYHPVFALRGLVPLLIQVPVFIAAYGLLSAYPPLQYEHFMGIANLGAADGLLGGVNLLPIVMTVINLMAAHVYSRDLSSQERLQTWIVAMLFFVLLYPSPAGLVLYWTCNNLFSLIKNLVYRVARSSSTLRRTSNA
ncbi:YidC/Oxa1 family membrane protein insertase [Pseudomonas sp. KnCO4]|uniref:YidC/Oxa1 family membrane protein insertase n=1 Tax=Pseudomonas sp. KnCO4 TaxID=3381355 RepID=UPI003877D568